MANDLGGGVSQVMQKWELKGEKASMWISRRGANCWGPSLVLMMFFASSVVCKFYYRRMENV